MPITATETMAPIRRPALGSAATAFLAKKHQMLIDGKWVDARSGQTFAVEDPANEEIIAHVPAGDKADIDLAVAARAPRLRNGAVVAHFARRAAALGLVARRHPRTPCRRTRRIGGARQRQAGHQRAPRRRRRLDRNVPLYGGLGDADEWRADSSLHRPATGMSIACANPSEWSARSSPGIFR